MEIELKLLIEGTDREKLPQHPLLKRWAVAKPTQSDLCAVYFDTPDFYLRRHDAGLRVRESGGQRIQTLKMGGSVRGGLHSRHEWEMPVDAMQPDLVRLREVLAPHRKLAELFASPSLAEHMHPLFSVRVRRLAWDLEVDGDAIELVLDEGVIEHGSSTVPVSEIELELKRGQPSRLYELALQLLDDIPLRLGTRSKAARGYALCSPSDRGAVKAPPVALSPHCTVAEGLQVIIASCLAHIHGNEDGVVKGGDVESLHQMRVGLRRLRSAFKLFDSVFPCPPELQEELRWLGSQLGAARDWDVLSTSTLNFIEERAAGDMPLEPVRQLASGIAQEQRENAAKAMLSSRCTRLFLSVGAWAQALETQEKSADGSGWLAQPLTKFAHTRIERGHRKIKRRGRRIVHADAAAVHRLRIACKQNRYAVEFFQGLYPPKRIRRYVAALSAMQDKLGVHHDMAVADDLLRRLQTETVQAAVRSAASFVRGYFAARLSTRQSALRQVWKKFCAVKMPYRS